jgi:hypothetical protein
MFGLPKYDVRWYLKTLTESPKELHYPKGFGFSRKDAVRFQKQQGGSAKWKLSETSDNWVLKKR